MPDAAPGDTIEWITAAVAVVFVMGVIVVGRWFGR
jgi:hypothetical protein